MNTTTSAPPEGLLKVRDLERLLQLHRRTIRRLCKAGTLPAPIKIGGSNRWKSDAVQQAIARLV